ncbi:protein kinase domain-containing protein [Frankia sp. CiP1_Cm_nod1]|uniref:protein kinase domain-containing protein n=1 Tax=Frankia sp. CiP1_Cm_nod1 TaxID=2897160 RepID=UPI0020242289
MRAVRVGEWLVDTSAPLGSGAFAEVLPAWRERAGMAGVQRAIKIYKAVGDGERQRRALEEIQVQEQLLGCPYVVAYVDAFLVEDGLYDGGVAQVMEMGDVSLASRLASERLRRMTVGEVAEMLGGVAEALDHIHARGLVHADLKPGNIVRCRGIWKVADFNATSVLAGGRGRDQGGTQAYMSPQRLAAEGHGSVRREDDMWSLGVVLGECLLGRLPRRPDGSPEPDAAVLAERIVAELRRGEADHELVVLLRELLSTDPALRPRAAATALRLRALAHRAAEEGTDLVRWSGLACSSFGNSHLEVFTAGRQDGLRHRWIVQGWSDWHGMAAPCAVRAIAVGSPREFEQHLWLLDHEGRIWVRSLAVDRETYAPVEDWSAWQPWPAPADGVTVVDLAATNAPWAQHCLLAVDNQGRAWCRPWNAHGGWSDWWALPDLPEGLVTVRAATGAAGVGALDGRGVLWRSPGLYTRSWYRPLPAEHPPVRGFALLPDDAVVVLTGEGVELRAGGMHTGPLTPAPAGDYVAVDASSRWLGHLELVLRDREDRILHTWAHRWDTGWWEWHPEWAELSG